MQEAFDFAFSTHPFLEKEQFGTTWKEYVPENRLAHLHEAAYDQEVVVFEHGGLRILAAPFSYQLIAKIDRLGKSGTKSRRKDYDLDDAAEYLNEYLKLRRGRTFVTYEGLCDDMDIYDILIGIQDRDRVMRQVAERVNDRFREKYHRNGIIFPQASAGPSSHQS